MSGDEALAHWRTAVEGNDQLAAEGGRRTPEEVSRVIRADIPMPLWDEHRRVVVMPAA